MLLVYCSIAAMCLSMLGSALGIDWMRRGGLVINLIIVGIGIGILLTKYAYGL